MSITCNPTSTSHTLTVTLSGGTPATGTLTVTPASGTGSCTASSSTSYSCAVPNSQTGDLSFTGTTSAGGSCSGTGSYTASDINQSISMTITCQTMRSLSYVLPRQRVLMFSPGVRNTLDGWFMHRSRNVWFRQQSSNFSCSVPNGVSGTLTFAGLRKTTGSNSTACNGSASFTTSMQISI